MKTKTKVTITTILLILLVVCFVLAFNKNKNQTLNGKNKNSIEPSFTQFKNKPKQAILHLIKQQKGECTNALFRADVGYIDIVWGENNPITNIGFGLKHIIEKHGKEIKQLGFNVEDFVPIAIQFGTFNKERSEKNKLVFDSEMIRFVVNTKMNGTKKQWLLTAFDLRKKPRN